MVNWKPKPTKGDDMCRNKTMPNDDLLTAREAMSFDEYQEKAHRTAAYGHPYYPWNLIAEEAHELSEMVSKQMLRGDDKPMPTKEMIKAEAGDILWGIAEVCTQQGISLQEVANYNINKLADRAKRGVLLGDGDTR